MGHDHRASHRRPQSPHRDSARDDYRISKRHDPSDRKHHKRKRSTSPSETRPLPFNAPRLETRDYIRYEPLLASYLDIQKGLVLEELDEHEAKGRWKSFVKKWNRGELAEGWYEPATLQKALASAADARAQRREEPPVPAPEVRDKEGGDESSEDEDVGPSLPPSAIYERDIRASPAIPLMQDLELKREQALEGSTDAREALREERRLHRAENRARLDELQPRAEPGTKERQLEKKRELAASNRQFAQAKEGGDVAEVPEQDLLGGGDEVDGYKRQKQQAERRKNEREVRREEILRARREEREERARAFREREEKTMSGLIELAKRRFG